MGKKSNGTGVAIHKGSVIALDKEARDRLEKISAEFGFNLATEQGRRDATLCLLSDTLSRNIDSVGKLADYVNQLVQSHNGLVKSHDELNERFARLVKLVGRLQKIMMNAGLAVPVE